MPTALAFAVLCIVSIAAIDGPLAVAIASISAETKQLIRQATHAGEIVFGFPISPYFYGLLLILAGLFTLSRKHTMLPWALLFVGFSHVIGRLAAGVLKPPFSRLRPFEALDTSGWRDVWFAPVGNSFPSGHAAHFWSLYFPLLILFPRYRYPLLILPVLISAARVAVNDHYLSDVLASAAISAAVTALFVRTILSRAPANSR